MAWALTVKQLDEGAPATFDYNDGESDWWQRVLRVCMNPSSNLLCFENYGINQVVDGKNVACVLVNYGL
eukprot:scaffold125896_cov21-Prasinocladus_malaysianus.AAC.1